MDIFTIIKLIGGIALFLYGMKVMGAGLESVSGSRLEKTLEKLSDKPVKGVLLGAAVTAIIQSSGATTVMVVGFVNSGIMKLAQSVGIIMGANIGTTVTAWILSLNGITGDSVLIKMLQPANFSPLFALVGICLIMVSKTSKKRDIGSIFMGFGVLMFGMTTMIEAMKPLTALEGFESFLLTFTNPVLGLIAGFLFTTILQSSSASIGIMQAMSVAGNVTYAFAIPMILGQNIGACTTALIACIGTKKSAKRAAFLNLYFKVIGVAIILLLYYGLDAFFNFSFKTQTMDIIDIAVLHTSINVFSMLVLLPFSKQLVRLAELSFPDDKGADATNFLDDKIFNTPNFAVERCKSITADMASLALETFKGAVSLLWDFSEKRAKELGESESRIDTYEDKLGQYLVKAASLKISEKASREVSNLLYAIGDFERIGDHAANLIKTAREINEKSLEFSNDAKEDIKTVTAAVTDILALTVDAFKNDNAETAKHIEPFEQVIDGLSDAIKARHIERLQAGNCTIELGFVLSDLLTNCERVSDHCSNIGVSVLRIREEKKGSHGYMNEIKNSMNSDFMGDFEKYSAAYKLI